MIDFSCPHCNKRFSVQDHHAGQQTACTHCRGRLLVPAALGARPVSSPVPAHPMPTLTQCPGCHQPYSVPDGPLTDALRCPSCGLSVSGGRPVPPRPPAGAAPVPVEVVNARAAGRALLASGSRNPPARRPPPTAAGVFWALALVWMLAAVLNLMAVTLDPGSRHEPVPPAVAVWTIMHVVLACGLALAVERLSRR